MENGKITAVKLEDGKTVPPGWMIRDAIEQPENVVVDGWQRKGGIHIQPDKRTKLGRRALNQMKKLIEPGQGEIIQALSEGGIITPEDGTVSVKVRTYKNCYYAAVQHGGKGPDLSVKFPDGIMEIDEDEFNWPDRPVVEILRDPDASNQEQS